MEKAELIKLLMAAMVGGLLKELITWIIGFMKVSLFGPMWKHSRSVITDGIAFCFFGFLLVTLGMMSNSRS